MEAAAPGAAQQIGKDCGLHGQLVRKVLPWELMERGILSMTPISAENADQIAIAAFEHLASLRSEFRKMKRDYEAQHQRD